MSILFDRHAKQWIAADRPHEEAAAMAERLNAILGAMPANPTDVARFIVIESPRMDSRTLGKIMRMCTDACLSLQSARLARDQVAESRSLAMAVTQAKVIAREYERAVGVAGAIPLTLNTQESPQ